MAVENLTSIDMIVFPSSVRMMWPSESGAWPKYIPGLPLSLAFVFKVGFSLKQHSVPKGLQFYRS